MNESMNECIASPELSEFVQGKLDPQRLDAIAAHLDACGKCQDTVIALAERSDTFVEGLRASKQSAEAPFQSEIALVAGLRRIASIAKRPASRESRLDSAAASSSVSPDDVGALTAIGPYRIESRLGIGGMGAVFKATHVKLKRTVALKMLPEDRWTHPDVIARFEREMEAIGQLDHPHIVRATDAGQDNGLHYLVMEFVDGLDLARMVRRLGALPIPDACELVRQAAVGLHYAHEHGLVHRDIKPSNLMLGWQAKDGAKKSSPPTVKVLDMGLALLGDEHFPRENELTTIGQLMGTLDYMSPEQGMDSHDVTATSDIFSLGATLYKLLTGRSPLDAMNVNTPLRKITTLATKDLPSIAEQRSDLPAALVQLVDHMLAREPQHRLASAAEVAEQLAPFAAESDLSKLLHRAVQAKSDELPTLRSQANVSRPNGQATAPLASESSSIRTGKRWLVALGLIGFLAVAGTLFRLTTDYGQLVIETDVDDVTVEVRQGERVVDTIEIAAGESEGTTTIHSGRYELVVSGAGDTLRLDKDSVTISRQGVQTVRVSRQVSSPTVVQNTAEHAGRDEILQNATLEMQLEILRARLGDDHPDVFALQQQVRRLQDRANWQAHVPTFDGRTYSEWMTDLETEKKAERLKDAVKALLTLGSTDQSEEAAKAIIRTMRTHGSIIIDGSAEGSLIQFVSNELPKMPEAAFIAAVQQEIESGNRRSREFLGWFLHDNSNALIRRHSNSIADLLLIQAGSKDGTWALEKLVDLCRVDPKLPAAKPDVLTAIKQGLVSGAFDAPTNPVYERNFPVLAVDVLLKNTSGAIEPDIAACAIQALESPHPEFRLSIIRTLQSLGPNGQFATPALLDLLDDEIAANVTFLTRPNEFMGGMGGGGMGGDGMGGVPVHRMDPKGKRREFYPTFPDIRIAILEAIAAHGDVSDTTIDRLIQATASQQASPKNGPSTNFEQLHAAFRDGVLRVLRNSQPRAEVRLVEFIRTHGTAVALDLLAVLSEDLARQIALQRGAVATNDGKSTPTDNDTLASVHIPTATHKTYDGKPLSEWLQVIDTERNPELLVPAVKAIGMLVDEQSAPEIAKRLFALASQYGSSGFQQLETTELNQELEQKMWQLPVGTLVDEILKALDQPNARMQLVLDHLVRPSLLGEIVRNEFEDALRSRESEFHQLLIEKADASQSGALRSFYVNYVISLHVYRGLALPKSQDFVTAMAQGISDWPYLEVLYTLSQVAPDTPGLADALAARLKVLEDANSFEVRVRLTAIGNLGAHAKSVEPLVIDRFNALLHNSSGDLHDWITCLRRMGLDSLRAAISSLESRTDSEAHTKVAAKLQQYLSDDSSANTQELKDEAFDYFKALREASQSQMSGGGGGF